MSAADTRAAVLMLRAALELLDPQPTAKTREHRARPAPVAVHDVEQDARAVLERLAAGADEDGVNRLGLRALEASRPPIPRNRIREALHALAADPARLTVLDGPRGRIDFALIATHPSDDGAEPTPGP